MMMKSGLKRPIVFPMKKDLSEDIVLGVLRTMQCSKADLEQFLDPPYRSKSAPSGSE